MIGLFNVTALKNALTNEGGKANVADTVIHFLTPESLL